jgi:molybdopterin molybdotransferase
MAETPRPSFNAHAPRRELGLAAARTCVLERVAAHVAARPPRREPLAPARFAGWPAPPVLAEDVRADRDYPPFARALRDGYALRAADAAAPGARLRCLGQVRAGAPSPLCVAPGTCVEIMTGAALPEGSDAVVMVEKTARAGAEVALAVAVKPGDAVAPRGSDTPAGGVVAAAGRRLDFAALAALAAVDCPAPEVFLPPRVAIITSGDELVAPGARSGPFQIRDANLPALAALVRRAGGDPVLELAVPDDAAALGAAVDRAQAEADLLLLSGGASVGAHDLVAPLVAARGTDIAFDAVRVRPGRPVWFGTLDSRCFFALPGNPLGSMLGFLLFVQPALALLAGLAPAALPPPFLLARLGFAHRAAPLPLTVFRPARLRPAADGLGPVLEEIPCHSSADLAAAAAADGFWAAPEHTESLESGSLVGVVLK